MVPGTHGSALFSRGDTQVLATATLGPTDLALVLRPAVTGGEPVTKSFFLHYDFPPYCTNETGRVGGVNRRMIGHGALAEKALLPVMPRPRGWPAAEAAVAAEGGVAPAPAQAEPPPLFPYSIRVTSEVSGSDGSSSMATVCGATLALLDAGVPLAAPVAGISIGAVTPHPDELAPGSRFVLLTDIFGLEDHSGDMDFKVAGTTAGVTAAQLDIKPAGLPLQVLEEALWRARDARLRVLRQMAALAPAPRAPLKPHTPCVEQLLVPAEYAGRIIGPGGSGLRRMQAVTGARVQLDRDDLPPPPPLSAAAGAAAGGGGGPDAAADSALLSQAAPGSLPHVTVSIYAPAAAMAAAKAMLLSALDEHQRLGGSPLSVVTSPDAPFYDVGSTVTLRVTKLFDFGAVLGVPINAPPAARPADADADPAGAAQPPQPQPQPPPNKRQFHEVGWLHVSELSPLRSVRASELLAEGDDVTAMVVDVDSRGRAKLSVRALLQPGENCTKYIVARSSRSPPPAAPSSAAPALAAVTEVAAPRLVAPAAAAAAAAGKHGAPAAAGAPPATAAATAAAAAAPPAAPPRNPSAAGGVGGGTDDDVDWLESAAEAVMAAAAAAARAGAPPPAPLPPVAAAATLGGGPRGAAALSSASASSAMAASPLRDGSVASLQLPPLAYLVPGAAQVHARWSAMEALLATGCVPDAREARRPLPASHRHWGAQHAGRVSSGAGRH